MTLSHFFTSAHFLESKQLFNCDYGGPRSHSCTHSQYHSLSAEQRSQKTMVAIASSPSPLTKTVAIKENLLSSPLLSFSPLSSFSALSQSVSPSFIICLSPADLPNLTSNAIIPPSPFSTKDYPHGLPQL